MKFLYFTDVHLKTKTPIRRTGDFEADVLGKIAFLLIEAQRQKVDFIVCGGDLFDLPNPSYRLAAQVLRLIVQSGINWYQVLGNHDILGHNPETWEIGVLAFFEQLPNFRILNRVKGEQYTVQSVHYSHGIEEQTKPWATEKDRYTILAAHAMIVPTPVPFLHTLPGKLKTDAGLVLCGHFHDPWASIVLTAEWSNELKSEVSNALSRLLSTREMWSIKFTNEALSRARLFINPGSVSRTALLAHNINRTPRALIIDALPDGVKITALPITVARPFDEAFKTEEAATEQRWETHVEKFLAAMENVRVEGIEAATLVTRAAKARGGVDDVADLPDEQKRVLEYTLKMIEKMESKPLTTEVPDAGA
jgi:predicted MPP superfamily phosphohydrolase